MNLIYFQKSQIFSEGNYYEVIYRVLRNKASEKDLEISKLLLDSIFLLLKILPENVKVKYLQYYYINDTLANKNHTTVHRDNILII